MKNEIIFFCCLIRIRDNYKIMEMLKQILQRRKHITFSICDALFIYYYFVLGLQSDKCLNFVEYYVNSIYNPHNLITNYAHNESTFTF